MQDSGSLAVFKVTARDQGHYKGPSGAFVTYGNISCLHLGETKVKMTVVSEHSENYRSYNTLRAASEKTKLVVNWYTFRENNCHFSLLSPLSTGSTLKGNNLQFFSWNGRSFLLKLSRQAGVHLRKLVEAIDPSAG